MAAALFAAITALRFLDADALDAIGFLYVVPIAALGVRFAYAGGFSGAALAMALTVAWAEGHADVAMTSDGYIVRAGAFAAVATAVGWQVRERIRERQAFEAQLRALAAEDELTGLPNRRAWDERTSAEFLAAHRSLKPLTLAMVDLDGLKAVNDSHGHAAGDRLLVACASAWSRAIRDADFLARIGGDEFALLLPDCDAAKAREVLTRMQLATQGNHTFSAGIASARPGETVASVMGRADQALYDAKASRERFATVDDLTLRVAAGGAA